MARNIIHIILVMLAFILTRSVSAGELVCNSSDGEYHHCSLPDADKLKVKVKYHAEGECKKGDTWGVDNKGIWVDLGCHAIFRFKDPKSTQVIGWKRFLPSWVR